MSSLGISNLYKHDWRVEIFLRKFEEGDLFELNSGKKISFFYDETVVEKIKNRDKIRGPFLVGEDLFPYKLTDIKKTEEFGGESRVHAEELKQIEILNDEIFNIKQTLASNSISLLIGQTAYPVTHVEKNKGNVKSDFQFMYEDSPVIWVSHKKGANSRHYQQWGGLSNYKDHKEVIRFVKDLSREYPEGIDPATTIIREIKDEDLMVRSIYGDAFGNTYNENNVTLVIQGDITLVSNCNHYQIEANHLRFNGELPKEEFQPVFTASYRKLRNDFGLTNTRITVSPIGGRLSISI